MPKTRRQNRAQQYKPHPYRRVRSARVVSWNMQGGGADSVKGQYLRTIMSDSRVTAICLQECGTLFGWDDSDLEVGWTIATHRMWNAGGGNDRCSLAILTRGEPLATHETSALSDAHRPIVGAKTGRFWVFSVHAPSGGNALYVQAAAAAAKRWAGFGRWICAGDYNLSPMTAIPPTNATVHCTGRATHQGGRELDYAVVSDSMECTAMRANRLISDHYAVTFDLEW